VDSPTDTDDLTVQANESVWQQRYIMLANNSIELLQEVHELNKATAQKEHDREVSAIKATIQKLIEQRSRLEGMRSAVGRVWENESGLWDEMWTLSKAELVHIKKEEEALENQIARCEENHLKRQA
jgi:uncharacterized membrane-anchored protein YjiN (DUF445 family)